MNRFSLLKIALGTVFMGLYVNAAQAEQNVLSSAPAAPQSGMHRPHGYQRCDIVPGGFRRGAWETMHLRCHYKHQHRVYETGYFRCARMHHGSCHHWKWVSEHWVRF